MLQCTVKCALQVRVKWQNVINTGHRKLWLLSVRTEIDLRWLKIFWANIWSEFRNTKEFWKIFAYDCYVLDDFILFLWFGISEIGMWAGWLAYGIGMWAGWLAYGIRFPIKVRSDTQFLRVHFGSGTSRNSYPMNKKDSVSRVKAADTEGDLSISVDDKNTWRYASTAPVFR
jgi:hypothetical protein